MMNKQTNIEREELLLSVPHLVPYSENSFLALTSFLSAGDE
jgi:hypothetical protein